MKIIKGIKDWIFQWTLITKEEIKSYKLIRSLDSGEIQRNNMKIEELKSELSLLKDNLEDVNDKDYWNQKWKQSKVYYKAPERIWVTEYVKYRQIEKISDIANQIIDSYNLTGNKCNMCLFAVMEWIKKSNYKYIKEIKEYWDKPEDFLKNGGGDCDGFGIFMYFIIREIFMELQVWEEVKHRLKCVAGNVNRRGDIPSGAGGHYYLLWLHDDLEWYTIETTYYLANAIFKFEKLSQKLNPMYGTIWFTFNEEYSWSQLSLVISEKDFRKL